MTYKVQVDDEVRDATPQEVAEIESRASEPSLLDVLDARQIAKQSAAAKLAALGLTDDELSALLGG